MPSPPPYFARLAKPDADAGIILIFRREADGHEEVIGQYENDYGFFERTFMPFEKDGRWFALYSRDYTATRIMELPSCKDLGGEEPDSKGFCPVEYFVPGPELVGQNAGRIAFVYGCHWAWPYEIQLLDISQADKGILRRDERLGNIDMPQEVESLKDCLKFHDEPGHYLAVTIRCDLRHFLAIRPDGIDTWRPRSQ